MNGQAVVARYSGHCWDCGDEIRVGETIVQGDDDHNYCADCAARDL